jgi:hypothetical protein
MLRAIRRISTIVYCLGVVGALAFGANEALARPVDSTCIFHFPIIGACTNTGDTLQDRLNCVNACSAYGSYPHSTCDNPGYCCTCRS